VLENEAHFLIGIAALVARVRKVCRTQLQKQGVCCEARRNLGVGIGGYGLSSNISRGNRNGKN